MTIDEQGRRVWRSIPAAPRAAFFSCLAAGYLTHLYAFTNLIPNADGLSRVFDLQQMTVSGRWFLHYASSLNQFTQMPAVIGLLSLLLLGLAAALAVDVAGLRSSIVSGAMGAAMAMFPCMGFTFMYLFTASAYCLAIFLAVLSVWLARKGSLGWLGGVLALALSMGTYQAYAAVSISLSVLVVFRMCLDEQATLRDTVRTGLALVGYLVAGAVVYYLVLQIFLSVKDLELLSYLGMDAAQAGYPFARLPGLIFDTYKQVIAFFFLPYQPNAFATPFMAAGHLVMLVLCAVFYLRWMVGRGLHKSAWRLAGSLAMLALLPLAINFGQIISPFTAPTPLMKYAFVAVYLLGGMLLELCQQLPRPNPGRAAAAVCLAALLLSFLNTNNLLYTAADQAHRATESYLTRLYARVEGCEGFEPGTEVVIIGAIPYSQLHSSVESYRQVDHYSVPLSTPATLNKHIYYYLNDWLNIPVDEPDEQTMLAVSDSDAFQAMPLYPADGSVQLLDGRVVVKLQEQYTPKSDYELAYENRR